nr:hypothetical protein [Desulfosporosinus sp.]
MTESTYKRDPIISEGMKGKLADYLAFRHYYRNSYSFWLKWNELKKLTDPNAREQSKSSNNGLGKDSAQITLVWKIRIVSLK